MNILKEIPKTIKDQTPIIEKYKKSIPVDLYGLANELGINVLDVIFGSNKVSGAIIKGNEDAGPSGYAIYLNKNHPETRKRFTLAHEIGHYYLHTPLINEDGLYENAMLRAEGVSSEVEIEANNFAAKLLFPDKEKENYREIYLRGEMEVEEIAKKINISSQAASYRLGIRFD